MRNYFIALIHISFTGYYFSNHFLFFISATIEDLNRELLIITGIIPMFFVLVTIIGMFFTTVIDSNYYRKSSIIISTIICVSFTVLFIVSILFYVDYSLTENLVSKSISDGSVNIIIGFAALCSISLILSCLYPPLQKQIFSNDKSFMFFYGNYRSYGLAMSFITIAALTELGSVEEILTSGNSMMLVTIGNLVATIGLYLMLISVYRTRTRLEKDNSLLIKEQYEELKLFRDSLAERVKSASRDLYEEKKRIETIVDAIPDSLLVLNPEGALILANRTFSELYQKMFSKKLDESFQIHQQPDHNLFKEIKRSFDSRNHPIEPSTIEPIEGLYLQLHVTDITTSGENPSNLGTIIELRDVTKFVEYDNLRKEFVSTVSHELRTPVTSIDLSIKNLQKYRKKLSEEQKDQIIEMVAESSFILNQMVEDLLIISGIESGQFKLQQKVYNPEMVINEVLIQMEPKRQEKKIIIQITGNVERELYGDPKRIGQIFRILVDNAIKYSSKSSCVKIHTIDDYQGKYNPKNFEGTLIQVCDEGIGIDKKDLLRVFDRFFRADNVKDSQGTGLGLSIARELVCLHKGEIYVESGLGTGSTFSVFLPRIEELGEMYRSPNNRG